MTSEGEVVSSALVPAGDVEGDGLDGPVQVAPVAAAAGEEPEQPVPVKSRSQQIQAHVPKPRKVVSMANWKATDINKHEDEATAPANKYQFRESLRGSSSSLMTLISSNHTMFGEPEVQRQVL